MKPLIFALLTLVAVPAFADQPATKAQWDAAYRENRRYVDANFPDMPKARQIDRAIEFAASDLEGEYLDPEPWRLAMQCLANAELREDQSSVRLGLQGLSAIERLRFAEAVRRCYFDLLPVSMDSAERGIRADVWATAVLSDLMEGK